MPLPSALMMTRLIRKISESPGSGYFHCLSSGCPTLVVTTYISPVPRLSCWKVAIFLESGDQSSTGRSLMVQPALLVAYPKSSMPSEVSWVSLPVATSFTQRLLSRRKAASLPSGDTISSRFMRDSAEAAGAHVVPSAVQVQRLLRTEKV